MIVEIDDTRHRASEWKVSGFTLDKPLPGLSPGDVRTAHIGLRISDLDIAFDIPCQVVRTIQMGAVDFQFLGAFTAQAALLHRIAEDHLAGHVTELDTLLRSSPTHRSPRKRRRFLLVALVSFLGVSIATLALVVLTSVFTVRSRVGAVSVDGIVLRAPTGGVIAGDLPFEGASVRAGQPLFQVVTPDATAKITELSEEIKLLRITADYNRARLSELSEVTSNMRNLTEQRLAAIKAKIAALDEQIAIYGNLITNRQYLADKGYHSQARVDEQRRDLQVRVQARAEAEAELRTAASQAELAKSGATAVDWRTDMETPETMRLRVSEADASISKSQAMLNAVTQSTQITSPCDCIVHADAVKIGETVEVGSLILTLRFAQATPVVVALISAEQSSGLKLGNTAGISLVNGLTTGRLEKLSYDDQESGGGRIGFFPFSGASAIAAPEPHMVRATISVPDGLDASMIGTPVQVAISTNPLPRAVTGFYTLAALL